MDDTTLKSFESLSLGSQQKLSEHEDPHSVDHEISATSRILQSSNLQEKQATENLVSSVAGSHETLGMGPTELPRMNRRERRAALSHESTSNGPNDRSGQRYVPPRRELHASPILSKDEIGAPTSTTTQSQPRRSNLRSFPRSQTRKFENQQTFHNQKASLSTEAAATNLTIPVRPKYPARSLQGPAQASSSPNDGFQGQHRGDKTGAKKQLHKFQNSDEMIHLPAPEPSTSYLSKVNTPASRLSSPQRLLLVLDLNGTLLFRTTRSAQYVPRPGLEAFLDYCFLNHSVLVWSSARPHNVNKVCRKVFNTGQQKLLLGQWARDTFGLSQEHYEQRVQVYKNLDIVWKDSMIQSQHPDFSTGGRWGQENTVLIDDSVLKASAQPFNLVEVREFAKTNDPLEDGQGVLQQVKVQLEELRLWDNVGAIMRAQHASNKAKTGHDLSVGKEGRRQVQLQDKDKGANGASRSDD